MNVFQVIVIILLSLKAIFLIALDGTPKEGNYSASVGLLSAIFWACLLYFGGFWI